MKALYVSPYLGFSGYSAAARNYVKALHDSGVDLVLRNIKYDAGHEHQLEPWEVKLFTRAPKDVDVIIQHLTPNEMARSPSDVKTKHIGVLATETDNISELWAKSLNRMDAVITFCDMSVEALKKGGVTIPVYKVPHTFDMSTYNLTDVEPYTLETRMAKEGEKPLVFYNISQISTKKGIDKLLRAYFGAFQNDENVALLLKGYFDMAQRSNEEERIMNFLKDIRTEVRLPKAGPVVVMAEIMDEHGIKRVHSTGDVYVNASSGEGWGIPMYEAAAYGNAIVSTHWGGPVEFLNDNEFYCVDHSLEPCYGMRHPLPYMFSSNENWAEPSVRSLIEQMREAYEDWKTDSLRQVTGLERFDHKVVGEQFKAILEEVASRKVEVCQ